MTATAGDGLTGSGSVTKAAETGKALTVVAVHGHFQATGPTTGRLQLLEGSTVVWEADVSGGLRVEFPGGWEMATDESVTLRFQGGGGVVALTVRWPL